MWILLLCATVAAEIIHIEPQNPAIIYHSTCRGLLIANVYWDATNITLFVGSSDIGYISSPPNARSLTISGRLFEANFSFNAHTKTYVSYDLYTYCAESFWMGWILPLMLVIVCLIGGKRLPAQPRRFIQMQTPIILIQQ
jgi:hypothetical protein